MNRKKEAANVKVVIVGCGTMGGIHAANVSRLEGVELAAVCDERGEAAQKLGERCHAQWFTSFERMVEAAAFDAVIITLPTHLHKDYTIKAAAAGKHVICEKPIAPTLEDASEMMETCKRNGVKLFVGHVVRFFPNYADIQRQVAAGAIGDAGVAHTKRSGPFPGAARSWYADPTKSGGVVMDLMIHDIDFVRWIFGEVVSVYAFNRRTENLDHALVTLSFEGGKIANLESLWGYPGDFHTSIEIAGRRGVIRNHSGDNGSFRLNKAASNREHRQAVAVPKSPSRHDPYYFEMAHFLDCIREEKEPLVSATDAYKALEIALAAKRSADTGLPIQLSGGTVHV